jgi:predicted aspartyl protease
LETIVDALIDTGFSSQLTLPTTAIASLDLAYAAAGNAHLADGSVASFSVYAADLEWGGAWRKITVYGLGNEVLAGTDLLTGHELKIAVVPGGAVEIVPLP